MDNDTATRFFNQVNLPAGWKYLGRHDIETTAGAVVQVAPATWLRVFHHAGTTKGGVVEKRLNPPPRGYTYRCLAQNKTADELNEFIAGYCREMLNGKQA